MICLRCGYCCVAYLVALPTEEIKDSGYECKYLKWHGDQAECEIHGQTFEIDGCQYDWNDTPCGRHTQIGEEDAPCRMGAFLRKHGKTGLDFRKEADMTRAQLEFKAEPDGGLVEVTGEVKEGDYVNWGGEAWTSVSKGSPLIGKPPGTLKFLRIVKA